MFLSGRKLITEPKTVRVRQVYPITDTLCAISYDGDNQSQVTDLYNVSVETMDVLRKKLTPEGQDEVDAVLQPDGPDADKHPECTSAVVVA